MEWDPTNKLSELGNMLICSTSHSSYNSRLLEITFIRISDVHSDRQTISLHYFNSYAVKDRVNLDQLSKSPPTHIPHSSDVIEKVLPTSSDQTSITNQHVILVPQMLCENITYFKDNFSDVTEKHIIFS